MRDYYNKIVLSIIYIYLIILGIEIKITLIIIKEMSAGVIPLVEFLLLQKIF